MDTMRTNRSSLFENIHDSGGGKNTTPRPELMHQAWDVSQRAFDAGSDCSSGPNETLICDVQGLSSGRPYDELQSPPRLCETVSKKLQVGSLDGESSGKKLYERCVPWARAARSKSVPQHDLFSVRGIPVSENRVYFTQ